MNKYYNIGAKYKIIGRIVAGTKVTDYVVEDMTTHAKIPMDKAIVEQMALNKQIYNCSAQVYNNLVNLKGINCKISKLPKFDAACNLLEDDGKPKRYKADLEVVGKIQDGRVISDYLVVQISNPDKMIKINRYVALKLAQEGRFTNIRCQKCCGEIIMRGTDGQSLNSIMTYRV